MKPLRSPRLVTAVVVAVALLLPGSAASASTSSTASGAAAAPDPTPVEVRPLANVEADWEVPTARLGGLLFFVGRTDATGTELWVTDGTPAGTKMVRDLAPGAGSSYPYALTAFKGRLYFTATTVAAGNEWWSTDGTASGTAQYADIRPGPASSTPEHPVVAGEHLFFAADDAQHGRELWVLDGQPGGARIRSDIVAGQGSSSPQQLTALGNRVVYRAWDAQNVLRPWVSSGAEFGAQALDAPGLSIQPGDFVRLGEQVLFSAATVADGRELWVTAGVPGDARLLRDIRAGQSSSDPARLTPFGDTVVFEASGSAAAGTELWSTDGTAQGTRQVADVRPGPNGAQIRDLTVVGPRVFFLADDGVHGREWWTTRGSAASTRLVVDAYVGPADGVDSGTSFGPVAGRLLYGGYGIDGAEPWVTDGTARGTRQVTDLVPGTASSYPFVLGLAGKRVVFGTYGDRLAGRLFTWAEAPGSSTRVKARSRYTAKEARDRAIVLRVKVTDGLGARVRGGKVRILSKGKVLGSARVRRGTAQVRIRVRLAPGRRYTVVGRWTGNRTVWGSTSAKVRFRVAGAER